MAQDYDVVLKLLFRSQSSLAVREIAGGPVKRWLDKELPAIRNTRADLIGETIGGDFVHLEFMSENQRFFELRMAGYYVEIYQSCGRHPRQALVYVGRAKLRMGGHFKSPSMNFRFRVVDLRTLNGERFLKSDAVGDQILSILMRLKNHREAIRRILATITTLEARDREDALGQLMVICGLRGVETRVEEEIRKVPVLNSLLDHKVLGREFKKGLEQGEAIGEARGEARGEAKMLRRQLEYRFKKLPKWVADKLATATPAQLEVWGERLLEEKSLAAIFGRDQL
jgi:hypothetical protein